MEEIDRVRTAGVRFGCVLADAVYGSGGPFRQSLSARGLKWAVGLSRRQTVYPAETGVIFPEAGRGRRRKYYASNLPADTTLKALASAINARWICEQRHQKLTEELGLDHFEGRSWTGLHRHALITMIAYAFLQSRRLKAAGREKQNPRSTPATDNASHQASHPQHPPEAAANTLPSL